MADDSNIVRFPFAIPHDFRRDGNISLTDADRLVWTVCVYLRDLKPCKGCPSLEKNERGEFVRGCRLMAQEVINICQTGNPHRKEK